MTYIDVDKETTLCSTHTTRYGWMSLRPDGLQLRVVCERVGTVGAPRLVLDVAHAVVVVEGYRSIHWLAKSGDDLDERASECAGCYPCLPCRFWDFWGRVRGALGSRGRNCHLLYNAMRVNAQFFSAL